jgi:hypothetical protein
MDLGHRSRSVRKGSLALTQRQGNCMLIMAVAIGTGSNVALMLCIPCHSDHELTGSFQALLCLWKCVSRRNSIVRVVSRSPKRKPAPVKGTIGNLGLCTAPQHVVCVCVLFRGSRLRETFQGQAAQAVGPTSRWPNVN